MKAISIRPPWAWAIIHAGKDVENRSWKTKLRGIVAIHASQTMSRQFYESKCSEMKRLSPRAKIPTYDEMVRSGIIGVVELIGCAEKKQSKWHKRGSYGFVLANPRMLRKPIPCKGSLNFWVVPSSITRRISAQLNRHV